MRLSDLQRYGFSSTMLDLWRQRQGEALLPVQRRAVSAGLLGEAGSGSVPKSMIVSAPTSSGKSFCAELAAVKALTARKRVVMLFPLKSLAEEKYRLFERTWADYGIKTLIVTGDYPENDRVFLSGDYQLAIAIYEKFDLLLTRNFDLLSNIGLVVVDEIQMISEPGRGAVLERMLTRILASSYRPSLLALSAALSDRDVAPLAEWMQATLVEETERPCDLIRGVVADGQFRFRSYNGGEDGQEAFTVAGDESGGRTYDDSDVFDDGVLASFIERIKKDDGCALVFLKSRADAMNLAMRLATSVNWSPATEALEQLAGDEPSFLNRSLTRVLSHGVAFHSADLSAYQRGVVEQAFAGGAVRALCSTTTLALGVNLPADTVYLETVKYTSGAYTSRPELVPISRAEFDNMTGRAGRLGVGNNRPGRAVVMADSVFDQEILWDRYISPSDKRPIRSAFQSLPLEDWLLQLVASGLASSEDDLERMTKSTLCAHLGGEADLCLENVLTDLRSHGLIAPDCLTISPTGSSVAGSGLTVRAACHYLRKLEEGMPESRFGWICLALSSSEWSLPSAVLSWYEQTNNLPVRMLYQRFDHSVEDACHLLPEDHRRVPLTRRIAAALKSALLLDDWCSLTPVQELEERYRMHLGQIQSLGETASHLIRSLSGLVHSIDREAQVGGLLADHAFSFRAGLPASFRSLYRRFGRLLGRHDFAAIKNAGVECLEEFLEVPAEELERLIVGGDKYRKVIALRDNVKEEVDMQVSTVDNQIMPCARPRSIEIDGSLESDRYLIRIDGFSVRLTGKSFKYLSKLAWSRLNGDAGWIYKEDIEVGFNQARYLYRMKNEINAGFSSSWPIIENNRSGYYRLNIEPDKIRINLDNLKNHPDFELRSLFSAQTEGRAVN